MIKYEIPNRWISYDPLAIADSLANAKAAVMTLKGMPYQREWVEDLQKVELKREVAGTSRIEGADFTEKELEVAMNETAEELFTRSQKQARAASNTYRWIATIPDDKPVDADLVCQIHRRIVTGADDDHCPPGVLRQQDENVNFGQPRHRGAEGGQECQDAFNGLMNSLQQQYGDHDPLIQAPAAHYHFAAMHPFLDGNGRTARALEALLLQRAGLRDFRFIAMSNYYYDEKTAYLGALAAVRSQQHDLTPFLLFGLKGIESQATRLLREIQVGVKKAIFRNLMYDLFTRLKSKKKRVVQERQIEILKLFLQHDRLEFSVLINEVSQHYKNLAAPFPAIVRDITGLVALGAIALERLESDRVGLVIQLDWPEKITETEFFEKLKNLPKAKSNLFL